MKLKVSKIHSAPSYSGSCDRLSCDMCLPDRISRGLAVGSLRFQWYHIEMFTTFCSHQEAALHTTLTRGDEAVRISLNDISVMKLSSTQPLSMEGVVIEISFSKANRGVKGDMRMITHGRVVHRCPLLHLAVHCFQKISMPHGGPLQWEDVVSGRWCECWSGGVQVLVMLIASACITHFRRFCHFVEIVLHSYRVVATPRI
jgi:hypothetical protein